MKTYRDLEDSLYDVNLCYPFSPLGIMQGDPDSYMGRRIAQIWAPMRELVRDEWGSRYTPTEELKTNARTNWLVEVTRGCMTEEERHLALSSRVEPADSTAPCVAIARAWLETQSRTMTRMSLEERADLVERLEAAGLPSHEVIVARNWVNARLDERHAREQAMREGQIRVELRRVKEDYRAGRLSYSEVRARYEQSEDHYRIWCELEQNHDGFSVLSVPDDDPEVRALMAELGLAV